MWRVLTTVKYYKGDDLKRAFKELRGVDKLMIRGYFFLLILVNIISKVLEVYGIIHVVQADYIYFGISCIILASFLLNFKYLPNIYFEIIQYIIFLNAVVWVSAIPRLYTDELWGKAGICWDKVFGCHTFGALIFATYRSRQTFVLNSKYSINP